MNILIVDDEKLIVDDLVRDVGEIFPSAHIDGYSGAADALASAAGKEYDIALLDIDMPEMDGITLARRLIACCPAVNIIFVTGYGEYSIDAHDMYCSAFLIKPVGIRKLRSAFEHLRKPFIDIPKGFTEEHYSGGAVIGRKIELLREQRGLSRRDIAEMMGVTRQSVYRWERGERIPDVLTFVKLARMLGVRVEDLLQEAKPR